MSAPPASIVWQDVTVRFGGRTVLDRFSCAVEPGARVAISGHSGCGKSTLLRAALGFSEPHHGTIRITGETVDPVSCWKLRLLLGYLPQEPELGDGPARDAFYRPFGYRANASLRPTPGVAAALLARLRLRPDILDAEISTLSGGEKQRLALATTLLLKRPILLLDEPTSALDADAAAALRDCLSDLHGITLVAVTHAPENLAGLWTEVVHIA